MIRSGVRGLIVFALAFALVPAVALGAGDGGQFKRADGLAVYLGLLPAAVVRGHPADHPERAMHGGPPTARHAFHVVATVFDAASGERIEDAEVDARVAPLGLAGARKRLEPMAIADIGRCRCCAAEARRRTPRWNDPVAVLQSVAG